MIALRRLSIAPGVGAGRAQGRLKEKKFGHVWGSRRFETPDDSTNNWWLALLNGGEGWGNNHHAYPSSARHAMAWYEFDGDWYIIWTLKKLGLVKKVRVARLPKKSTGPEANEAMMETT